MRKSNSAFTIVELLVSVAVLVVLVLLVSRLFSSAATVTTSGNKRMDAEAQIRPLFERMATDFSQMIKRSDVDYYLKSSANLQAGNDQIAFYSAVPGYLTSYQSSISVIAYRVNTLSGSANYNKLERMAKGLIWNGAPTPTPTPANTSIPILFAPISLASPSSLPSPSGTPAFPTAGSSAADPDYELIAPYVFRFEYYYLLKNGTLSGTPWDTTTGHTSVSGLQDVAAVAVCIATVDPKSRVLVSDTQLTTLAGTLVDFSSSMKPGDLLSNWQTTLNATTSIPRPAITAVRIYERYFYLTPKP